LKIGVEVEEAYFSLKKVTQMVLFFFGVTLSPYISMAFLRDSVCYVFADPVTYYCIINTTM